MASLNNTTLRFGNESLTQWELVGSGGFGDVYKARHKDWGFDVAVKILHSHVSLEENVLNREAVLMEKVSCEFVLRVYGNYLGSPPFGVKPIHQGIVMEFMSRGSVESLLGFLSGPPPWPLAFRLAHQVALGMNFLHSRNLIHQDLKPSNVLLSDELNVKLADFGLSTITTSVLSFTQETQRKVGGSYKYMPPEAFEASYEPVRAFDRYSYGVLLWTIMAGKEPYPNADFALVALRIPLGDRPPSEVIDNTKVVGLKEMVDLMKRCWWKDPSNRPTFKECLQTTENVLSKHKTGIHKAVHEVLTSLDSQTSNLHSQTGLSSRCPPQTTAQPTSKEVTGPVDSKTAEQCGERQSVNYYTSKIEIDKANFVDENMPALIQNVSEVIEMADELGDMVHREIYSEIRASRTDQERMRILYGSFRSGGVRVKAAFYDILKKHQPSLVEKLGGRL